MHIVKQLPLLAVVALVGCELSTSEPPPDPGIAAAERAVKRMLIDPESARFTGVVRHPETGAICGFVNAKNRYGGYAGPRLFASKDGVTLLIPRGEDLKIKKREAERLLEAAMRPRGDVDRNWALARKAADEHAEAVKEHKRQTALISEWCAPGTVDVDSE